MLCGLALALLYGRTQFAGFQDAETMELAHLGRQLQKTSELKTRVLRPIDLWLLERNQGLAPERLASNQFITAEGLPDLRHAPAYPWLLAKLLPNNMPAYDVKTGHAGEWRMVRLGQLSTLLAIGLVYLLGAQLFHTSAAWLAALLFTACEPVWAAAISGRETSLMLLLFLLATNATACLIHQLRAEKPLLRLLLPVGALLLSLIGLVHLRYAGWIFAPTLLMVLGLGGGRRGWGMAIGLLFLLAASATPWTLRNLATTGSAFGYAPYAALAETYRFPEDRLAQSVDFQMDADHIAGEIRWKVRETFPDRMHDFLGWLLGAGLAAALFVSALFIRFATPSASWIRWAAVFASLLLMPASAFFGERMLELIPMLYPIVLVYGAAFFYMLLNRLEARLFVRGALQTLLVILTALPILIRMLPPNPYPSWPTYYPPVVQGVTNMLDNRDWIATDIPWATAWYGDQNSVLLTESLDPFGVILDTIPSLRGLYFTARTLDRPFYDKLIDVDRGSWLPICTGEIAIQPYVHGFLWPSGTDHQMVLLDAPPGEPVEDESETAPAVLRDSESASPPAPTP